MLNLIKLLVISIMIIFTIYVSKEIQYIEDILRNTENYKNLDNTFLESIIKIVREKIPIRYTIYKNRIKYHRG